MDRLVAERVPDARCARLPPGVRHLEAPLRSREVALHPVGITKSGPGEAAELVEPLFLEGLLLLKHVRHMDCEVGEVDGFECLLRGGPAALADQELAQSPAHEPRVRPEVGKAGLWTKKDELFQKPGSLSAGPGEGGVDQAEHGREGLGLMQLEQPAACLSANRAGSQQVEELLILLRRSVDGEQALQSGSIEMLVIHAFLSCWVRSHGSNTVTQELARRPGRNGPGFHPAPGDHSGTAVGLKTGTVVAGAGRVGRGPPFGSRMEPVSAQRAESRRQNREKWLGAASWRSTAERTVSPWGRAVAGAGMRKTRVIRAMAGTSRREQSRVILTS